MVRSKAQRPPLGREATWSDLEALTDDVIGEIVSGKLVVSPRPGAPHADSASTLGVVLGGPFALGTGGGPGGWKILFGPRVTFAAP